ncbi:MAG: dihydropteroate synthase [Lachnospiraceae bacterium]|nr:dihydropteroate synthase [Lachnospiraceae bacterium]
MKIGNREYNLFSKTYIMGILNVTPDSFSDGGKWNHMDTALKHAEEMMLHGAAIIDIGGESTRPGYQKISEEEEEERIIPVISAIKQRFDIPVSVDTYKAGVAKQALIAGADMINDIWGLKADPDMARVIARSGAACCLMHNRDNTIYVDFVEDVKRELMESVSIALEAGIPKDKIMLDPGVGFGKTYGQNLKALKHVEDFKELGYPLLIGTSRKSVIGNTLDLPVTEREEGTIATTVLAVKAGVGMVRVHNVEANRRAIRMTRAILNA